MAASASTSASASRVTKRMPALFICHGGGPMPMMAEMKSPGSDPLVQSWKQHRKAFFSGDNTPTAIAVISAHYETSSMRIGGAAAPEMYYDYGGFPPETYNYKYPAPGAPDLAAKAATLLANAGIQAQVDSRRPYDHGVFVPLMGMFPEAEIPVIPISVLRSQDPEEHLAVGAALSPLRDEGVLLLGSGASSHNFAMFGRPGKSGAEFHRKLEQVICEGQREELKQFLQWPGAIESQAPGAAEHFTPLLTVAGSSPFFQQGQSSGSKKDSGEKGEEPAPRLVHTGKMGGMVVMHFLFEA